MQRLDASQSRQAVDRVSEALRRYARNVKPAVLV